MILGGGASGRWLGHVNGPLMNEINAFKKRSRALTSPIYHVRTKQEGVCYESGRRLSLEHNNAGVLVLDFPSSRTFQNKFLLFITFLVCGILLEKPEWTKRESLSKVVPSPFPSSLPPFFLHLFLYSTHIHLVPTLRNWIDRKHNLSYKDHYSYSI